MKGLTTEERALILAALERTTAIENKWKEFVDLMCKALGDDGLEVEVKERFEHTFEIEFDDRGFGFANAVFSNAVRAWVSGDQDDFASVAKRTFDVTIKERL